MDIILKSKSGFSGRIIDVMVEESGNIMLLLESDTDVEWFDGDDLEPCDHATLQKRED